MVYLVDGSNVVGVLSRRGMDLSPPRLCAALDRFCRQGRSSAVVVFDAVEGSPPGSTFPASERVSVRCASRGGPHAADHEIVVLARKRKGGVTVVTDDVDLAARARREGAVVVGVTRFWQRVRGAVVRADEKEAAASGVDAEELLRLWKET